MKAKTINDAKTKMEKSILVLRDELGRIRTGRANLSILDGVRVQCYGSLMPLNQVATLSVPESRLITIVPWDKSVTPEIERAISKADIGMQPVNDGKMIRLPIPALNEERRKDLVRQIKKIGEDVKVSIRNSRREANDALKNLEKGGDLSEDEHRKGADEIQKMTDKYIIDIDEIVGKKEKEVMEV